MIAGNATPSDARMMWKPSVKAIWLRAASSCAASVTIALPPAASVPGAGLGALAVVLVEATLVGQHRAGRRDVVGEGRGQRVPERQLDQRSHDLHMVGVGREGVRGHHPAPLGG